MRKGVPIPGLAVLLLCVLLLVLPTAAADRFNNTARWSSFDLATVNSTLKGFSGGVSSGGYVYFTPYENGVDFSGNTVRYDTTKSFTDPASWEYFNGTRINPGLKGFSGAAASGSYIYYIPHYKGGGYHGNSVRYDTTKPFTDPASWEYFDIQTVDASLEGFYGAVASGNSVYYLPYYTDAGSSGTTVRYDTTKPYTDAASWEYFDMTTVDIDLQGFYGGTGSGNYVYYAPYYNDNIGYGGVAARYNTAQPFTDAASWEHYDIAQLDPALVGFGGAVSSGDYVYYIPYEYGVASGSTARYDTTKPFTNAASWEYFDTSQVNETLKGFFWGTALGNHVYYAPYRNVVTYSGTAARYDTTKSFTSAASWEQYNMTPMNSLMKGFWDAVSSGDAVYYIPNGATYNGVVGRYDAMAAPLASFTGTPVSGTVPLAVTFTDTSTGNPTLWNWSFGDGNVSSVQSPGHTYSGTGIYSVNLTVSRIGESDSLVQTGYITVNPPAPIANFTASPVSGTAPLAVQFTDASTGTITSRSWDFGDGGTSTLQDPSHSYPAAGSYSVNLTVTGPGGSDSEVKAGLITVSTAPSGQSGQTGSSGGSSTPSAFAGSSSGLKAGQETTLRYQKDSMVRSIEFVPAIDLPNVMVITTKDAPLPKNIPRPSGTVLGTFDLTLFHARAGDLGTVTLRFRIPASRLAGTGLSPGDVVLMRAGEAGWEDLPTEFLEETDGFLTYEAVSPGFSTFAIVGVPGRAANVTVTQETMPEATPTMSIPTTAATVQTTHGNLPLITTTAPAATPTKATPVSWAALLLSLAVPVLFRRRRE